MTQESLVAFQRFPRQNASRSQRVPVRIEEKERDTATQGPRHVLTFMIRRGRLLLAIGGLIDGTGYSGSRERERERWGGEEKEKANGLDGPGGVYSLKIYISSNSIFNFFSK